MVPLRINACHPTILTPPVNSRDADGRMAMDEPPGTLFRGWQADGSRVNDSAHVFGIDRAVHHIFPAGEGHTAPVASDLGAPLRTTARDHCPIGVPCFRSSQQDMFHLSRPSGFRFPHADSHPAWARCAPINRQMGSSAFRQHHAARGTLFNTIAGAVMRHPPVPGLADDPLSSPAIIPRSPDAAHTPNHHSPNTLRSYATLM
jgi:hypothetical protein